MAYKRRPSLLGGLLWATLGLLFLLRNFGIGPDVWSVIGRFWPVILILLGVGKILEYFLKKDAVAIRIGEIIGILFLLLIGSAISRVSESRNFSRILREIPLNVGGTPMRPGQWFGDSHTFSEEVTYPLESSLPIRVENAYGEVSVTPGSDREVRIRLRKVVYADEARAKSFAAEIHLMGATENRSASPADVKPEAEPGKKNGSGVFVVRTNRDSLSSRDIMFNTDMEILVPKDSQVQVVNTYGEVRATGLNGKLDLSTTHRSLEARDCSGQFNMTSRYAECRLTNLKGNLSVDGRGKVFIEDIKGNVTVTNEYSPLEITNVDGTLNVSITEGKLKVEKVTKPVVIDAKGTQVEVAQLQDTLKIRTSHRDIDITDVASTVTIESRYSTLNLKNVKGSVSINSNSDSIEANEIGGSFVMNARGSGIRAAGVRGPLDIQTTLKDVSVNDFGDRCTVSNEYAGISISSQKLGKGDLTVKNRNGDVELYLPEGASFSIEATARNGSVESDYAGLAPTTNANVGSLRARMKTGSPKITLETDSSDIHVYRTREEENKRSSREDDDARLPAGISSAAPRSLVPSPSVRMI
jgi:DUF4097 and DUF4098 domain-containing protein YvlB